MKFFFDNNVVYNILHVYKVENMKKYWGYWQKLNTNLVLIIFSFVPDLLPESYFTATSGHGQSNPLP